MLMNYVTTLLACLQEIWSIHRGMVAVVLQQRRY